jgi:hypothetical protein
MRLHRLGALCAGLFIAAPAWAGRFTYTLLAVASPASMGTGSGGLTDQDVVVGTAYFSGGAASQGVVFKNGTATLVPGSTGFTAVSSNGIAIGTIAGDGYVTYKLTGGKLTTHKLRTKPNPIVLPIGINASRLGIATARDKKFKPPFAYLTLQGKAAQALPPAPACANGFVSLAGLNDAGLIGGTCDVQGTETLGYIYQNGATSTISAPNADATDIAGVAQDGTVGGGFQDSGGDHGYTYNSGTFTQFDMPGGSGTRVFSFGPGGEIGGYYYPSGSGGTNYVGFIEAGGAYHKISPAAYPTGITVTAINAKGSLLLSWYPNQTILAQCPRSQQPCTQ